MKEKIDGLRTCPQRETVSRQVVSTEKAFAYRCSGQVSTRTGQRVQRVADSFPGCPEQREKIRPLVTKKKEEKQFFHKFVNKSLKNTQFFFEPGECIFSTKRQKTLPSKKRKGQQAQGEEAGLCENRLRVSGG